MGMRSRHGALIGLTGLAAALAGCVAPSFHAVVGTARTTYATFDVAVGDPWREFSFVDTRGDVQQLSDVRGRITALVFAAELAPPDCAMLQRLDEITRRAYRPWVALRIVYIAPTECAGLAEMAAECALTRPRVVVVCDPEGHVRRLYGGAAAAGRYVLLNNFLDVTSIGDAQDPAALEAAATALAREIYSQDYREGAWRWYY